MESKRSFFFLGFAICSFLLYQAWQKDYAPQVEAPISAQQDVSVQNSKAEEANLVTVITDLIKVKIDKVGGDVVYAELLNFNKNRENTTDKVVLFDYRNRLYQAKSALLGTGAPDNQLPRADYQVPQNVYQLVDGQDSLDVVLNWTNGGNVSFKKIFSFKRGEYTTAMQFIINNKSQNDRTYNFIAELVRDQSETGLEEKSAFGMAPFLGVAYSPEEQQYEKADIEDLQEEPIKITRKGGWVAYLQHYFISSWIPEQSETVTISSKVSADLTSKIQFLQPSISVIAGTEKIINAKLYIGPKDLRVLEEVAPGLDKTMDLSWVWWIGIPLYKMLTFFYSIVGNWGVAIILITVCVKTLLYPISAAQYKSMANMRKLQPKMQKLKERYGEDKQRMQQEMMKMYKEEGANPFGGCLPMLLQFPIFIALYYVLFEAVELRHAPFFGWIQDLSVADPYFVLPILMGASMWFMQKMQPVSPTMDPMQQKMMQYLPVVFSVFMLFFPAGLVLYWLCNNLLSVAQQTYITKKIENAPEQKKSFKKKK